MAAVVWLAVTIGAKVSGREDVTLWNRPFTGDARLTVDSHEARVT
jgi:hypothetical protein